jgi:hypothetical protein
MARVKVPAPGFGWFPTMDMPTYLALEAWSKGPIIELADGWPAAKVTADRDVDEKPGEAASFGTAVHLALADMDAFRKTYGTFIDGDGRTAAVRDSRKKVIDAGKTPICESDFVGAVAIVKKLRDHPLVGPCLRDVEAWRERTGVWIDPDLEIPLRFRPDLVRPKQGLMIDWKTTVDPTTEAFMRVAWPRYCVGAVHYTEGASQLGVDVQQFVLVAIQSAPPWCVNVVAIDEDTDKAAYSIWRRGVTALADIVHGGPEKAAEDFQGVSVGRAPEWALRRENQR